LFRFNTKKEYEQEVKFYLMNKLKLSYEIIEEYYDDLVDEYISFCEVSGSGK
jgi:hypothetical protein